MHAGRTARTRGLAAALLVQWLLAAAVAPALHAALHHTDDHVHLPDGAVVYFPRSHEAELARAEQRATPAVSRAAADARAIDPLALALAAGAGSTTHAPIAALAAPATRARGIELAETAPRLPELPLIARAPARATSARGPPLAA